MTDEVFGANELASPQKWQILGLVGLIIQGILGIMSFWALLIKRYFESPKRPWIVWLLDNSKQAFSVLLQHWMNMMLAVTLSQANLADNCDWYFINFTVDVFLGVALWYLGVITIEKLGLYYQIEELNTGVYIKENTFSPEIEDFHPAFQMERHDIDYRIWVIQIGVWGFIVIAVKWILFTFQALFAQTLETISNVLLGWLNMYPNIKLVLIMMIIPLIFNAIQFWIQDNILKAKKETNIKFISLSMIERRKSEILASKAIDFNSNRWTRRSISFTTDISGRTRFK